MKGKDGVDAGNSLQGYAYSALGVVAMHRRNRQRVTFECEMIIALHFSGEGILGDSVFSYPIQRPENSTRDRNLVVLPHGMSPFLALLTNRVASINKAFILDLLERTPFLAP